MHLVARSTGVSTAGMGTFTRAVRRRVTVRSTIARTIVVLGLTLVVFLVAAVALSRGPADPATRTVAARAPVDAFTGPAAAGSLDAAIAALQDRLRAVPDDASGFAALGLAYVQQAAATADPSWYAKADEVLVRSLALAPEGNADAFVGLAALATGRHDFEEALGYGRRALALDPYDAAASGAVGDALLELGRTAAAFRTFQRMVDTEPSLASYARVSYARELSGDLAGAIEAMRTAGSFAGTEADAAWAAAHIGMLELHRGRLDAAADAFRETLARAPGSVLGEAGLARIAAARGDLAAAASRLERLVARFPSVEYAWMLGDVRSLLGDRTGAQAAYDLVRIQIDLAHAGGVDTDVELALFEATHGDPIDALRAARAGRRSRKSVHAADALAWALHANGRDAAAARYADRALALGTPDGSFLYHAGAIALARDDDARAEGLLARALRVDPHFSVLGVPEAERLLEDVRAR